MIDSPLDAQAAETPAPYFQHYHEIFANWTLGEIERDLFNAMESTGEELENLVEYGLGTSDMFDHLHDEYLDWQYRWNAFRQAWSSWERS